MPDDFFRIRLVCTLLDFCGGYFDRGVARKKLDFFLTFFQACLAQTAVEGSFTNQSQYYIATKETLPMDIDFMVQDSYALTRPQWKLVTNFNEAGRLFAELVKQNYKLQGPGKNQAAEPAENEASSSSDEDGEDAPVPDMDDGQESSDDAEVEVSQGIFALMLLITADWVRSL